MTSIHLKSLSLIMFNVRDHFGEGLIKRRIHDMHGFKVNSLKIV